MNSTITARRPEQGFTLVELAIVMIIIGLLLGGLLKGQELISNARVTSTVAQVKNLDAATSGFRDKYDGLPGDMVNAAARLPACTAANNCAPAAADGNGLVDVGGGFAAVPANEARAFFLQLSSAQLVSGIQGNGLVWGGDFPQAEAGGGFHVSYWGGGGLPNQVSGVAANVRAGHYLALHNTPAGAVLATAAGAALTPSMAFRIDNKMDDGNPQTGTIFPAGVGPPGATGCTTAANIYNEAVDQLLCNIYVRFQQ